MRATMGEAESLAALKQVVALNDGGIFWQLLRRPENFHFFKDRVRKPERAYFTPNGKTLTWSEEYTCNPLTNEEGLVYFEFVIDLSISGQINEYNTFGRTFFSADINFDFTIHGFVFRDYGVNQDDIRLLNGEQKSLLVFHKYYEKETARLNIKSLEEGTFQGEHPFSFFTRIWKHVDNDNQTMVDDSSAYYFDELTEALRNFRYSVACANVWGRYITSYKAHSYTFQGGEIYPIQLSYFDYRYFFYLESAIEELYTYYERLAYLFYLFAQPQCFEAHSLSYQKLFERNTRKELKLKYPQLQLDVNFAWFYKRTSKEHRKLAGYRHPLVHYKTGNNFIRGSYMASFKRIWLKHAGGGEQELTKLFHDIKDIEKFINAELVSCPEAFERMILLIEQLQDAPAI